MKKLTALIFGAFMFALIFTGCTKDDNVNIVMPSGAPALVFAQMMSENQSLAGRQITYQVVSGTDGIIAKINEFDIAVMPTNIAAKLYNSGEDIQLLSLNVHGVLYMTGPSEITNLNQLIGKTVYNIGRGGTPDITLRYLFDHYGIDYTEDENDEQITQKVLLKFEQEGSTLVPKLITGAIDYAVIGEPVISQAISNSNGRLVRALDIKEEWQKATEQQTYPQACVVAKKSFIKDNPEFISALIEKLQEDVSLWIQNNLDKAQNAIKDNGGTMPPFTAQSVQNSNIEYLSAAEAKSNIEAYLNILINQIGGNLPSDGFYYI